MTTGTRAVLRTGPPGREQRTDFPAVRQVHRSPASDPASRKPSGRSRPNSQPGLRAVISHALRTMDSSRPSVADSARLNASGIRLTPPATSPGLAASWRTPTASAAGAAVRVGRVGGAADAMARVDGVAGDEG